MSWIGIAILGVIGLLLIASPPSFFEASTDAGSDARLQHGLSAAGAALLHLAALCVMVKLVSG